MIKAAGILFQTPDDEVLFLKRGLAGDHPGEWCFPGGTTEEGETAEQTAVRETLEEIGTLPGSDKGRGRTGGDMTALTRSMRDDVDFTTFSQRIPERFDPTLNDEHTGFTWAKADQPPEPLHPGARVALARLTMDELGIARAMAAGDMTSPQKYANVWLWCIRISGCGLSYRSAHDEYVWRDASLYLNDDMIARCNGLPVLWVHPEKSVLDSKEFGDRVIGTVFLPYVQGQELWAVAKIYDETAAREMTETQFSTSPGVAFADPSVNETIQTSDGTKLLIEGKPSLLDHIAIVAAGVWDKGGPPIGVQNDSLHVENGKADSMNEAETAAADRARKDAEDKIKADAEAGQKLDKLLTHLDSITNRLDAMEMADKSRKDAEEKEKADRADAARKDAASRRDAEHEEWKKADAEGCAKDDAEEDAEAKELEAKGEPKEVAADKARKDRKDRMDARKADAEAKAKADAEGARKDSVDIEAMRRRLAALEAAAKGMPEEERAAFADHQARADGAYISLGARAPAPMQGENFLAYRIRLARGLQKHSPDWKGVELGKLPPEALTIVEQRVYADAALASRSVDDVPEGVLIPRKETRGGHEITEYRGRTTIFKTMSQPSQRATAFLTQKRA